MVQPVILTANDSCILSISSEKANIASQLGFILSCMMGTGQEKALSFFAISVYIRLGPRCDRTWVKDATSCTFCPPTVPYKLQLKGTV
jgi:hypothetical protein